MISQQYRATGLLYHVLFDFTFTIIRFHDAMGKVKPFTTDNSKINAVIFYGMASLGTGQGTGINPKSTAGRNQCKITAHKVVHQPDRVSDDSKVLVSFQLL